MKKTLIITAFYIISCQNGIDIDTTKHTAKERKEKLLEISAKLSKLQDFENKKFSDVFFEGVKLVLWILSWRSNSFFMMFTFSF